ncbi:MAG: hypothetical protein KY445_04760, partial [Armatimonadetes bacterium]|nr:hypothetical protein [Armatimonadota bacterium]
MLIQKPVWGPSPEFVSNDKLNAMSNYAEQQGEGALRNRGAYDAATPYKVNDFVTHQGTDYRALVASTAVTPGSDATIWKALDGGTVNPATNLALGTVKLSIAPADAANPIAVGINHGVGGVLSGDLLNPGFAQDMAYQSELDAVATAKADVSHTHAVADIEATGTRDDSTFLRGDGTFAVPPGGSTVIRSGVGAPSNTLGANGDYYHDTATGNYFQKSGGAYAQIASLRGPAGPAGAAGADGANGLNGANGAAWRDGAGLPNNAVGVD